MTLSRLLRAMPFRRTRGLRAYSAAFADLKSLSVQKKGEVAIIKLNQPNSKVNTLGTQIMPEFQVAYEELSKDPSVKAAVLISGKPDNFIAGADIEMLRDCRTATEASDLSQSCQELLGKVEKGSLPVVAAIHGVALGGGLEVALACHYRIATKSSITKVGLPEVMLGLLPGGGGCIRLPKLIGVQEALPLILTGKEVPAVKAKKLGIVDDLTEQIGLSANTANENTMRHLEDVAVKVANEFASGKRKISRREVPYNSVKGLSYHAMHDVPQIRDFVFKKALEGVMKQTHGLYPAPLEILKVIKTGLELGPEKGYEHESRAFGDLTQTTESKACIGLFFGRNACKKIPAKYSGSKPLPVKNVSIMGAGLMGAGIAEVSLKKFNVLLKDATESGLARGLEQIGSSLQGKVKRKRATQFQTDQIMESISTTTGFEGIKNSDIIIEAVPESLPLKHKIIEELDQHMSPNCIFATNTSALPIGEVAKVAKKPERVVGMHYFSPVPKMQLMEVIPHDGTLPEVTATAFDIGTKQGKTCIVVKDVPGFYVNRSLGPFMAECMRVVGEGADPEKLDKALVKYGFPIGPISLADEVGLDVAGNVQVFLAKHLGKRMEQTETAGFMMEMVSKGLLGRKTGKGFFLFPSKADKGMLAGLTGSKKREFNPEAMELIKKYRKGGPQEFSVEDLQQRPTFMFMNEAAYCLQDGIILSPTDGDIGLVFGTGFPPSKGGPFRFLDTYGIQNYVDQMYRYRDEHGERFTPCPLLLDYAKQNKKFFN